MKNLFKSFLKLIKLFTRKILIDFKNVFLKIIYFYLKNRFFIKKMDQKTIYLIIFIVLAILVGAFFILYLKLKRIEKNNVELQKHIIHTNNIIETYINPSPQRATSEPNLQQPTIPLQQPNIPLHQPQSQPNLQQLPKQQPPNPMSAIGNMLPMMGTIMNMFGGESVASPEDIEEEAKQMMEEDQKRRELENEIQQELSELAVDIQEGRVDEDEMEEDKNNDTEDNDIEDDDIEDSENIEDLSDNDDDLESDEEYILDSETDDIDLESDNGEELEEDKGKNEEL